MKTTDMVEMINPILYFSDNKSESVDIYHRFILSNFISMNVIDDYKEANASCPVIIPLPIATLIGEEKHITYIYAVANKGKSLFNLFSNEKSIKKFIVNLSTTLSNNEKIKIYKDSSLNNDVLSMDGIKTKFYIDGEEERIGFTVFYMTTIENITKNVNGIPISIEIISSVLFALWNVYEEYINTKKLFYRSINNEERYLLVTKYFNEAKEAIEKI